MIYTVADLFPMAMLFLGGGGGGGGRVGGVAH